MSSSRPPSPTFPTAEMQVTSTTTHCQTMRGHTNRVTGVVHLSEERRIITCSLDSSLRLWDAENGTQIGDDWRDEGDNKRVSSIALSPNSKRVASGSKDGTVRLWNVETGKVVSRWKEHSACVQSVCWSPTGERVLSGSWDGTARVWNAESGETILGPIKTEQEYVFVAAYSPDGSKFATGGYNTALKIWDSSTGESFQALRADDDAVVCLTWTSDGKKFLFSSSNVIRIFDTVTWQEVAALKGHKTAVAAITLSRNDRLLASTSWYGLDQTLLWDLDTNLQIGLPLHHEKEVYCAAISADGTRLVTGCDDKNAYMWDVGAILKEHHLERLLPNPDELVDKDDKSHLEADATGAEQESAHQSPEEFFRDTQQEHVYPPVPRQSHLSARRRLGAFVSSLTSRPIALLSLLRPRSATDGSTENARNSLRRRDLSNWWLFRPSHSTRAPIVDVPLAQGQKRTATVRPRGGTDNYVLEEDYAPPPSQNPDPNLPQSATAPGTTEKHGGGCKCFRFRW